MGFLFDFACITHDFISPGQRFKRKVAKDSYDHSRMFSGDRTCFKCNGTGTKTFPNGKSVSCNKCGGSGKYTK